MGCRWTTRGGRRVRVGPVGSPVNALSVQVLSVGQILNLLNLPSVSGSPTLTREELQDATVRIWRHPEAGYFTEARLQHGSAPVFRHITPQEATLWEASRPTPAMIAHAFELPRVPVH